jgi:thioredoxin
LAANLAILYFSIEICQSDQKMFKIDITQTSFQEQIMAVKQQFTSFEDAIANSELPILVDFYATWCGPCQMMSKILEQVNIDLNGQIRIMKIDTDRYPQIASTYQIQALPTLMLFKNGQSVDRIEGVLQAPQLIDRIGKFL